MSATQSLLHLARLDRVKELIFTGRKFSGQEAYEYGLATVLSDSPQDTALKMAAEIANKNPEAIRAAKQLLNQLPHQSVKEGLIAESNCSRELMGTDNQIEAVMSTFEARPPLFK
jgi:enoyl-CoA hydratase/carnithine racemase